MSFLENLRVEKDIKQKKFLTKNIADYCWKFRTSRIKI